jgi:hypothetical protein
VREFAIEKSPEDEVFKGKEARFQSSQDLNRINPDLLWMEGISREGGSQFPGKIFEWTWLFPEEAMKRDHAGECFIKMLKHPHIPVINMEIGVIPLRQKEALSQMEGIQCRL